MPPFFFPQMDTTEDVDETTDDGVCPMCRWLVLSTRLGPPCALLERRNSITQRAEFDVDMSDLILVPIPDAVPSV